MRARSRTLAAISVATILTGCAPGAASQPDSSVEQLTVRVVRTLPHDPTAFTEGFEISGDRIIEGTGRSGRSVVTATDLATGAELARVDLAAPAFGEGITVAGPVLWQVTYKDGIAIARDPGTLAERRRVTYDGEGWGLCTQPSQESPSGRVVMSNGSATLTFRDPESFMPVGRIDVTRDDHPVSNLNELECTPDGVYANIWKTDTIVRIDPESGRVTAVVDASALRGTLGDARVDVLNGIAAVPGTDRFLVTGKLWPSTFEVEFVPDS